MDFNHNQHATPHESPTSTLVAMDVEEPIGHLGVLTCNKLPLAKLVKANPIIHRCIPSYSLTQKLFPLRLVIFQLVKEKSMLLVGTRQGHPDVWQISMKANSCRQRSMTSINSNIALAGRHERTRLVQKRETPNNST